MIAQHSGGDFKDQVLEVILSYIAVWRTVFNYIVGTGEMAQW